MSSVSEAKVVHCRLPRPSIPVPVRALAPHRPRLAFPYGRLAGRRRGPRSATNLALGFRRARLARQGAEHFGAYLHPKRPGWIYMTLCAEYLARLQRYGPAAVEECRAGGPGGPAAAIREESARLAAALDSAGPVWVLDERGRAVTSVDLARRLGRLETSAVKRLTIVLGGAYGLDESLRRRGECLALSPLTFPHELCRALVLEQLYRARTIQRGEPYHH